MERVTPTVELFGTADCPYTREAREYLIWENVAFVEYDVNADSEARARMLAMTGGQRIVPVILRDGRVSDIGWRGRGCTIGSMENGKWQEDPRE